MKKEKIFGFAFFSILVAAIIFLIVFSSDKTQKHQVNSVEMSGNTLLPKNNYFEFANVNQVIKEKLSLSEIRNRLIKHKYIDNVDIELDAAGTAKVEVFEKEFFAGILINSEIKLITKEFEIIPVLNNTNAIDYPVILDSLYSRNNSDGIYKSFIIVNYAKEIGKEFYKNISQIIFTKKGEVILYLTGINSYLILGKDNFDKKLFLISELINRKEEFENFLAFNSYIDLRFTNNIYIGSNIVTGI